ncbi:MAG TPA: cytochrome C oxidase subunit IV family protein [Burkholderiales bacterium]|nr:cytochrome C oxidase subunit IV family protein [Burkholderiales bacterium]
MKPYRRIVQVWVALLALLALTFGSAYVPMGVWNGVANFAIAAIKAALVALFFMHLRAREPVLRLTLATALFMLAVLLALGLADYATRERFDAPWEAPASAGSRAP